jgi:hypothetical protein
MKGVVLLRLRLKEIPGQVYVEWLPTTVYAMKGVVFEGRLKDPQLSERVGISWPFNVMPKDILMIPRCRHL